MDVGVDVDVVRFEVKRRRETLGHTDRVARTDHLEDDADSVGDTAGRVGRVGCECERERGTRCDYLVTRS